MLLYHSKVIGESEQRPIIGTDKRKSSLYSAICVSLIRLSVPAPEIANTVRLRSSVGTSKLVSVSAANDAGGITFRGNIRTAAEAAV